MDYLIPIALGPAFVIGGWALAYYTRAARRKKFDVDPPFDL